MDFCSALKGDYFDNSPIKTTPCRSPSKVSSFGIMSVMTIETTFLEDQMINLTKFVEGLSTSLKAKDHDIAKLMNKLESMNKGSHTLATKALQVDQLDVIDDYTIRATRNIRNIIDGCCMSWSHKLITLA
jgi:hypothetical protein